MQSESRRTLLRRSAIVLFFLLLAFATTWPLVTHPTSHLSIGQEPVATVPLFNLWTMWWNADRAANWGTDYWDAPIFHPADRAFAFSEPQPTTVIVAPILWLTGSRVLTYNAYLWLSLTLNGVAAFAFSRQLKMSALVSLITGTIIATLPIVHRQLGVVQLVPLWGIIWTWSALLRLRVSPKPRYGIELGLAFGVTFLMSGHHGLFHALLLIGTFWILWPLVVRPSTWTTVGVALVVAAILTVPIISVMCDVMADYEFRRDTALVSSLSARPRDYLRPWGYSAFGTDSLVPRAQKALSPGWIVTGLTVLGLIAGLWYRPWRVPTAFLTATMALAFVLSQGPTFSIFEWKPWLFLAESIPGVAQVRSASRFAFFVQLASGFLSGFALQTALTWGSHQVSTRRGRSVVTLAVIGLGGAAAFEFCPLPNGQFPVPSIAEQRDWISYVVEELPQNQALVCIPFSAGGRAREYESTTRWMYFGTFHAQPLVNGYSGFFPSGAVDLRVAMNRTFPSPETFQTLADSGAGLLVIARERYDHQKLDGMELDGIRLELVFDESSEVAVYRLSDLREGND